MQLSKTVVINCAGTGSRLGFGFPKALLNVAGKPLIAHHLESLRGFDDVRIVVGFEAPRLIEVAKSVRRNVVVVFNHDYLRTNTLASLCLGARFARDMVVSIDGDLLIKPSDLQTFLASPGELLGYTQAYSDQPVYVKTRALGSRTLVTEFNRRAGTLEWSGLVQMRRDRLRYGKGFVYQLLKSALPMEGRHIECREIDTPDDLRRARVWADSIFHRQR